MQEKPINCHKVSKYLGYHASKLVSDNGETLLYLLPGKNAWESLPATLLGEGTDGRIKLAYNPYSELIVAVKRCEPHMALQAQRYVEFDIKTQVYLDESRNVCYIVMPYFHGKTARAWMMHFTAQMKYYQNENNEKQVKYYLSEILHLFISIIEKINYFQQKNIHHGDLHLDNIIYSIENGQRTCVLIDPAPKIFFRDADYYCPFSKEYSGFEIFLQTDSIQYECIYKSFTLLQNTINQLRTTRNFNINEIIKNLKSFVCKEKLNITSPKSFDQNILTNIDKNQREMLFFKEPKSGLMINHYFSYIKRLLTEMIPTLAIFVMSAFLVCVFAVTTEIEHKMTSNFSR